MNSQRNDDQSRHDDFSTTQTDDGHFAVLVKGPSRSSNAIVSDPTNQEGIFRFSVTSANTCA
jgi:hypothetical protein